MNESNFLHTGTTFLKDELCIIICLILLIILAPLVTQKIIIVFLFYFLNKNFLIDLNAFNDRFKSSGSFNPTHKRCKIYERRK